MHWLRAGFSACHAACPTRSKRSLPGAYGKRERDHHHPTRARECIMHVYMGPTQMPDIGRRGGGCTRPANKAGGGTSSGLIERWGRPACATRPRKLTTRIIFSAGPLSVPCMCCLDRWHPFWLGADAECGIIGCTHVFHGVILYVGGEQQQRQPKHCGLRLRVSTGWVATCNKSAGGSWAEAAAAAAGAAQFDKVGAPIL